MDITIDGRPLTLDEKLTVLEAARRVGVEIPTLCWHPRVSVLGACRLCMIEVEGIPRLLAACTTQVSDKMEIRTDTPQLRKVRETMMELLLCRHPMDCPTCVKGGECELQELAYRHSAPENRFPENPSPYPVRDPSPFVERDPKKCVLCRRCVRVCREVRGTTVLGAMERGCHKQVGTFFQNTLDSDFQDPYNCEFCGSCINICPVGALNSKQRKFRARTWEGEKAEVVCPFCSVGCLLTYQVKEGELVRSQPRTGPNNQDQACFRGRFGSDYLNHPSRVTEPLLRQGGKLEPVSMDDALRWLKEKSSDGTAIVISSSRTTEEINAADSFARKISSAGSLQAVDSAGLDESVLPDGIGRRPWEDLDEADMVFVAGQDFTIFQPVAGVRIRVSRSRSGAELALLDSRDTLLGSESSVWLRPPGAGLPLVLAGLIRILTEKHSRSLHGEDGALSGMLAQVTPEKIEKALGLEADSLAALADRLAEKKNIFIIGHRGWYDPEGQVPRLLEALDRLLAGDSARGIAYLRNNCNSVGASEVAVARNGDGGGSSGLCIAIGADPAGTAFPGSPAAQAVDGAASLAVIDSFLTPTAERADLVLPLPTVAEEGGSFTASNGLAQSFPRSMTPPDDIRPLKEILSDAAAALGGEGDQAGRTGGGEGKKGIAGLPPLPGPEKMVVFRGIPLTDYRLRIVEESAQLFPAMAAELHPDDASSLGLKEGDSVRLVSGEADIVLPAKVTPRTPPGQIHVPFDPRDEAVAAFASAARPVEGWPFSCRGLTDVKIVPREGGE